MQRKSPLKRSPERNANDRLPTAEPEILQPFTSFAAAMEQFAAAASLRDREVTTRSAQVHRAVVARRRVGRLVREQDAQLRRALAALVFTLLSGVSPCALAAVSAAEALPLGQELTPVGAERAGNREGSIPAWTPGKQQGELSGQYFSDPVIDAEKPLFVITRSNAARFAGQLTEGHKRLLGTYESYKIKVYPSHRRVTWPEPILKATVANATRCELPDPDTPHRCKLGFPFPIPRTGAEPIWNHKLKWRGEAVTRYNNQFIVQADGRYQQTQIVEDVRFSYASLRAPVPLTRNSGEILKYFSRTVSPPRVAGSYILVHERPGTGAVGRAAWLYSPGLKRLRRAPGICCDNPYEGTDGHEFFDQVDLFNGALDRYDWTLVGKKEMFIPYDSNRIAGNTVSYRDLIRPGHVNADIPRYELHRVWIVEANLKPGMSHTLSKRRFYLDEDSWTIVAVDGYDNRKQLFQFQEGHLSFAPNILAAFTVPEVIYHFATGRYFITAAFNEDRPYDLTATFPGDYFTPASVQKRTTK